MSDRIYRLRPCVSSRITSEGIELWDHASSNRCVLTDPPIDWHADLQSGVTAREEGQAAALDDLVRREFLEEVGNSPHSIVRSLPDQPIAKGFAALPAMSLAEVYRLPCPPDAVIVGVPYERGGLTAPGSSLGPALLRTHPWQLDWHVHGPSQRVTGLYDIGRKAYLFENAGLVDIGDLGSISDLGRMSRTDVLSSVEFLVERIVGQQTLPVLIGGDHSLTAAAVAAVARRGPLVVVQFDAHTDYAGPDLEPREYGHVFHDDFVGHIRRLPNVRGIVQLGLREADPERMHSDVRQVGWLELRQKSIRDLIPADLKSFPLYVTVDLDVLDPVYMPNTGAYLPGGLRDSELVVALEQLCEAFPVKGLDFVEVTSDPVNDQRVSVMVTNLILRAVAASLRFGTRNGGEGSA